MKKIYQLPKDVIAKIAAGEIVERPCRIVKELVENSLDAGATTITISVQDGGKKEIIIADNGHGMGHDDAMLSVAHHTTSKLKTEHDLVALSTYGFRGEALSSIAAVSHFSLKTRIDGSTEGYEVAVSGGTILRTQVVAHPVGTTITVSELFFNTPARQKFLKKESTELHQIKQLIFANCFSSLSVHFILSSNERRLYSCPGVTTLLDRFIQIEGLEASKHMLSLQKKEGEKFTISGIISDTQYVSYDRSDIFIFVNNRWIKNSTLTRSLIQGYQNSLPHQKFPRAVIHITIDPAEIDINIHPKKEEVRFLHPRRIEMALTQAVKETLELVIPSPTFSTSTFATQKSFSTSSFLYQQENPLPSFSLPESQKENVTLKAESFIAFDPIETMQHNRVELAHTKFEIPIAEGTIAEKNSTINSQEEFLCIGQLFQTYILASQKDTFYLIDQHAAHERLLFEKIVDNHQGFLSVKQAFPIIVPVTKEVIGSLMQSQALFASCGIMFEQFDQTTLIVTATPAHFAHHDFASLFDEVLAVYKEEKTVNKDSIESHILHKIRCSIACKSAVKAGDQLDQLFMMQLLTDLSTCNNRFCCPHGRPTIWEISQYEIEKRFKRKL